MTEQEIDRARKSLRVEGKGALRGLFYKKNGLPKQALFTKRQILDQLGILSMEPNSLEYDGLMRILAGSLAYLRRQAKESSLAWLDIELQGRSRHGYSDDIDKIVSNAEKFESIASGRAEIAKQTRKIATQHLRLLESRDKETA